MFCSCSNDGHITIVNQFDFVLTSKSNHIFLEMFFTFSRKEISPSAIMRGKFEKRKQSVASLVKWVNQDRHKNLLFCTFSLKLSRYGV